MYSVMVTKRNKTIMQIAHMLTKRILQILKLNQFCGVRIKKKSQNMKQIANFFDNFKCYHR